MIVHRFVPLAIVFCLLSSACQLSLGKNGLRGRQEPKAVNPGQLQTAATSSPLSQRKDRGVTDKEFVAYRENVWQKL